MRYIKNLFHIEENKALSCMIIAVGLVAISSFISNNINTTIGSFISISAWIYILRALSNVSFNRGNELGSVKPLVMLLLAWNFFMVVYGLMTNPPTEPTTYYKIRRVLTDEQLLLPLLFPLVLFFDNRNISLRFLFYWLGVFAIVYLILSPWSLWSMTHFNWSMQNQAWGEGSEGGYGDFISNSTRHISVFLPTVIAYYSKRYISNKWWKLFVSTFIISLFMMMYMARRGGTVLVLAYFLVAYWVYFRRSKRASSRITQILLLILAIGLGYALFTGLSDSAFSLLIDRGMEDTRSGVEDSLFADFNRAPIDWWIGRGLWGTYYDPGFDSLIMGNGYRWAVETGYLTMIIHGGYIYLGLYLCILIYAGIKGLSGKNILVNSFGAIILMTVVELYPYGLQSFNYLYLTVWMGVYICCQRKYRNMSDKEIYKQFFQPRQNSTYNKLLNKIMK